MKTQSHRRKGVSRICTNALFLLISFGLALAPIGLQAASTTQSLSSETTLIDASPLFTNATNAINSSNAPAQAKQNALAILAAIQTDWTQLGINASLSNKNYAVGSATGIASMSKRKWREDGGGLNLSLPASSGSDDMVAQGSTTLSSDVIPNGEAVPMAGPPALWQFSSRLSFTITWPDNAPPQTPPTISMSAGGVTVAGGQTGSFGAGKNTQVTFNLSASDADGNFQSLHLSLQSNGGSVQQIHSATSQQSTFVYTANTLGTHVFRCKAVDATNLESSVATLVLTVANQPPSITLNPITPATISNGQPFGGSGTVSDPENSINSIAIYVGGRCVQTIANPAQGGFSFSCTPSGFGLYQNLSVYAKVTDNDGASATSQIQVVAVKPAGADPLIRNVNSFPGEGIASGHYGYGPGNTYPASRSLSGGFNSSTGHHAAGTTDDVFRIMQNADGSLSYDYLLWNGDRTRGDELAIYIKDPVTRWFLSVGHYQRYEDTIPPTPAEWIIDLEEIFETEADMRAKVSQLGLSLEHPPLPMSGEPVASASSTTWEWRVIHTRFWTSGFGTRQAGSIPFDPSWQGKEMIACGWALQGTHNEGNRIYYKSMSRSYTLSAHPNPSNIIELLNTGTIFGSMPLDIRVTVTPPAGLSGYRFGVLVQKWQGDESAKPGIDGWTTVHQTSAPVSGQYVWHDSAQPAAGGPCKVVYRLYSWQEGTLEWVNYAGREIIVKNSSPGSANITLSAYEIKYGQSVTVTGALVDPDGNLKGHSLWVIAPDASGDKNPEWDCYSRTLDPDWWQDPRISEEGWGGAWNYGRPSNGHASVVSGTFKPYRLGVWQLHTNGCDMLNAWGPGATKDLSVAKATPDGVFQPKFMNPDIPVPDEYFDASFRNPHDLHPLPVNAISYSLTKSGTTIPISNPLAPGEYELSATYPGDDFHMTASKSVLLVVNNDPSADNDGDGIPNSIEARLGTSPTSSGTMDRNALEIKILTPISTED